MTDNQTPQTGNEFQTFLRRAISDAVVAAGDDLESEVGSEGAKIAKTVAAGAGVYILAVFNDTARVEGESYRDEYKRLHGRVKALLSESPADVIFLLD